ncbi:MAG: transglycosylase SLT domain-containing protein, partial [Cellvibrionaceae bacterium]|nr:transglycosylase SLT domain-containing protein [Cellvibrionaceae bacterium]
MYKRGLVLTLSLLLGACGLNPQQSQTPAAEKAQHILPVRPDINAIGKQPPKQKPFVATPVKPQTKVVKPAPVKVSDLWQRIRQGYGLDHISNSRIDQQRRWYTRHPEYIQRVSKRAKPYLYHIVSELKRRQMPMELALLPIVESAFDPFAYSHGRASGLWQFTPPTARDFKLANTWWYDGRRDVEASTAAALDYLHQLNRRFDGDWLLALAAYNAGGGTVSKAIRKNKRRGRNTDFWSLSLPKETRAYVPRLLAMAEIVARPQAYRVSLHPILNQPYFKRFDLPYQLDLSQAAKLAQLPMDEIHLLNPGYSRWATDPSGAQHLLIPLSRAQQFRQNLDQL